MLNTFSHTPSSQDFALQYRPHNFLFQSREIPERKTHSYSGSRIGALRYSISNNLLSY